MKTIPILPLLASLATGFALAAAEPPADTLAKTNAAASPTNAVNTAEQKPALVAPAEVVSAAANATSTNLVATNAAADLAATNLLAGYTNGFSAQDGLRLNFRNAPLETVLNYLSEAAGFIIVLDTEVRGRVDIWSNQPVTKEEAITLLNSVLSKNGYAAIRNDRTLTIVARDSAKTRDIPVKRSTAPEDIPKNEEIVTQIIPVRFINATQVTKDLQPLMPLTATMTANESGNSLVITDTQANIRRMAEIVKALDTSISSLSTIRVYPLKYADAKTVATVLKDLFQTQDSGQRTAGGMAANFFARMRGGGGGPFGGGPGGPGGGGPGGGDTGSGGGRAPTPKVVATSDDRSNSLVVSMPDEYAPTIDDLVKAIDINVEDVTEVRVFRLKYADPVEMADLLAGLFPDDTRSDTSNRGMNVQFGGFGGFGQRGGGARGGNTANPQSDRMKKMGKVLAVADQRTASVVVSAAKDLMVQIAAMVEQLDANPAKKQKVFVYKVENADVTEVEQILRDMFDRNGTSNNRNTGNQNNVLNNRSQQTQGSTGSGIGNSGTGGSRGLGSGGGLGGSGF